MVRFQTCTYMHIYNNDGLDHIPYATRSTKSGNDEKILCKYKKILKTLLTSDDKLRYLGLYHTHVCHIVFKSMMFMFMTQHTCTSTHSAGIAVDDYASAAAAAAKKS